MREIRTSGSEGGATLSSLPLSKSSTLQSHPTGKVAGGPVRWANLAQFRLGLGADAFGVAAAGVEAAAGGRVDGAGHVALQDDPAGALEGRIGDGHGREQGLGAYWALLK